MECAINYTVYYACVRAVHCALCTVHYVLCSVTLSAAGVYVLGSLGGTLVQCSSGRYSLPYTGTLSQYSLSHCRTVTLSQTDSHLTTCDSPSVAEKSSGIRDKERRRDADAAAASAVGRFWDNRNLLRTVRCTGQYGALRRAASSWTTVGEGRINFSRTSSSLHQTELSTKVEELLVTRRGRRIGERN